MVVVMGVVLGDVVMEGSSLETITRQPTLMDGGGWGVDGRMVV